MKSSLTPSFDARRITDKAVVEIVNNIALSMVGRDDMMHSLKLMRKDHKSSVPLIKRLLSSGSPTARKMVANVVSRAFSHITEAHKHSDDDPVWFYRCESSWHPTLGHEMNRAWHCGNLMDEFAGLDEAVLRSFADSAASSMNQLEVKCSVVPGSDAYWRGITALAITKVVHRNDRSLRHRAQVKARTAFFEDVAEFIGWAGKHDDIVQVVTLAKERKTINVLALSDIIAQGKAAPALRSGVI